jgi:hypothetical protein
MASLSTAHWQRLLATGNDSDFTIECHGRFWKLHKVVLCAVSDHFAVLCRGSFEVRYSLTA